MRKWLLSHPALPSRDMAEILRLERASAWIEVRDRCHPDVVASVRALHSLSVQEHPLPPKARVQLGMFDRPLVGPAQVVQDALPARATVMAALDGSERARYGVLTNAALWVEIAGRRQATWRTCLEAAINGQPLPIVRAPRRPPLPKTPPAVKDNGAPLIVIAGAKHLLAEAYGALAEKRMTRAEAERHVGSHVLGNTTDPWVVSLTGELQRYA